MGLRQKASLRRTQISDQQDLNQRSSSPSPRKSKTTKRPAMKLVTKKLLAHEPGLDAFLDPKNPFEEPAAPPLKRPEGAPSRVIAAVDTLGKLESAVLTALFPPTGEPPATLEEISEELGMSTDEVKNIADEALRGLRGGCASYQRVSKAWN